MSPDEQWGGLPESLPEDAFLCTHCVRTAEANQQSR